MELEKGEKLCHCGTVDEALEKAEKLLVEIAGTDCPVWAFQIGCLLRSLAISALVDSNVTQPQLKEIANSLSDFARKNSDIELLLKKMDERRVSLYGR